MANWIDKIKNTLAPAANVQRGKNGKDLRGHLSPQMLQRFRQDVLSWRESLSEAEQAWYPHRVKMQRLYLDTVLNGHVAACMERRKDLTMLRAFAIYDEAGNLNEEWTRYMQKGWFRHFVNYTLDALFYGYQLIALGDITDGRFQNLGIIKRHNISPDRMVMGSMEYAIEGYEFAKPPYSDWHIYVSTPTENALSKCGYGLLYKVAVYEIYLRNLTGQNATFTELYSQPYRIGKTTKTSEEERAELERALVMMGSNGYAILDPMDEIAFLETALGGNGYQGYDNFEKRLEQKISKLILGHADALDSVPGKLGAGQGNDNPVSVALADKQQKDGDFVADVVNDELLPRLRKLVGMPEGLSFGYRNDAEMEAARRAEDENNKLTAEIAQAMKSAGLKMSAGYFMERTGIVCEEEMPVDSKQSSVGSEEEKSSQSSVDSRQLAERDGEEANEDEQKDAA